MSEPKRVCAALLASGASSRFESHNKLEIDWGGVPLILHMAMLFCGLPGIEKVFVAIDQYAQGLDRALQGSPVEVLYNTSSYEGMSSSVRLAVGFASAFEGILLCPADMPHLTRLSLSQLIEAWNRGNSHSIAAAYCDGVARCPAIFGADWYDSLNSIEGDQGARSILGTCPEGLVRVELPSYELQDIDQPADLW